LVVAQKELDAKREQQQKQHENRSNNNNTGKEEQQLDTTVQDEFEISETIKTQKTETLDDKPEQKNKRRQVKQNIEIVVENSNKMLDEDKAET